MYAKLVFLYVLKVIFFKNQVTNVLTEVVPFCKSGHNYVDEIMVPKTMIEMTKCYLSADSLHEKIYLYKVTFGFCLNSL